MKSARVFFMTVGIFCYLNISTADAQDTIPQSPPDNTQMNRRDRNTSELTADKASNQKSDIELMRMIRKSIMADKSLSTNAHNVKIIAENGKVTLKGPVQSDRESQAIGQIANKMAGVQNVTNALSVNAAPSSSSDQ